MVIKQSKGKSHVKISIRNLDFSYSLVGDQKINVIDNLNLDINDREFLSVVGASGCGKSTLLNIIAGLLPPQRGTVMLDGNPITNPGPDRTMVFQDDAVFPWYSVKDNVAYGVKNTIPDSKRREKEVEQTLILVGLSENAKMFPRQLSGGMRKRVDVARAIITRPQVLLMDEPFAALDVMTKQKLQEEFLKIWNETMMTVIFVTHDLEEALYMADRVVVMASNPGRILEIVDVPFSRPREKDLKTSADFARMRRDLGHIFDTHPIESQNASYLGD